MVQANPVLRIWCAALAVLAACRAGETPDTDEPLAKATPATVSNASAWALFDRSIASGLVPGREPIQISLDREAQLSLLKVYGASPYTLRVRSGDGRTLGFDLIDLSSAQEGWQLYPSSTLASTKTVELAFEPIGATPDLQKVPEVELWAVSDGAAAGSPSEAIEDLNPRFVPLLPDVRSAELLPGEDLGALPGSCATFPVNLARSPATFRRLHLVYEAEGIAGAFALSRSVNGLGQHGGGWLPGDSTRRTHSDELDPSLLHLGANEIRLCIPRDASRGVAVSDVRLVAELDTGTNLASSASIARGADEPVLAGQLLDHDAASSASVASEDLIEVALDRLIAPDAVTLEGVQLVPSLVRSVDCIEQNGTTESLSIVRRVEVKDAQTIVLDGSSRSCRALSIRIAAAASLSSIDVGGSGAAERVDWPRVVVTSPREHFGDRAWLGGFVAKPEMSTDAIRLDVAGEPAATLSGEFGRLLSRDAGFADAWPVAVKVTYPGGKDEVVQRVLDGDASSRVDTKSAAAHGVASASAGRAAFGEEGDTVVVKAKFLETTKVRLGSRVGLDVPAGAVSKTTDITVRHLGTTVLPPLDPGMINVTAPRDRGYEFLPHGIKFRRAVEVVVPYDPTAIPEGMTTDDVHTYYFDPSANRWRRLERAAIDVGEKVTRSKTDHFTIMINAVLTTPKNPTPLSFDPTALASIPAASPAANVDLMQAPEANAMGDARTSLPIQLPRARGYQPSLAFSYSSSGGNGWMGVGWDLGGASASRIEIDTRWGVPDYAHPETHRYVLDGAALVPTLDSDGPSCSTGETAQRFHPRVEGGFTHILRCGADASSFHWELRDTDGTLMIYGALPDEQSAASLRGPDAAGAGIFRWSLRRVVDVHGNTAEFFYAADLTPDAEPGRDTYLSRIDYSSSSTLPAAYSVRLVRDVPSRRDAVITGRPGFKVTTRHLLRAVEVYFGTELVRSYVLVYAHGQFGKTVLKRIQAYGLGGCSAAGNAFALPTCGAAAFFHEHVLDYLEDDTGFTTASTWELSGPGSTSATLTNGSGVTLAGSFSVGLTEAVKGEVSGSRTDRRETIGLYDINGDGLPDQLFSDGFVLYNQWHPDLLPFGPLFSDNGPSIVGGFPAQPRDITWSGGVKITGDLETNGWGPSAQAGFDSSVTRATRLITDVNGDGFVDVVFAEDDGTHQGGTAELGRRCGSAMCFSPRTLAPFDLTNDPILQDTVAEAASRLFVADPVIRWVAPYTGALELSGTAQKAAAGGSDGVTIELYVGDTLLEARSIAADDTQSHAFPSTAHSTFVTAGDVVHLRLKTGTDEGISGAQLADLVRANLEARYSSTCRFVLVLGFPVLACTPITDPDLERDATGLPVFSYSTGRDLRVSNRAAPLVVPVSGVLQLSAQVVKQVAAAPVRLCVQRFPAPCELGFTPSLDEPCDASGGVATNVSGTTQLSAGSQTTVALNTAFSVQRGQLVVVRVESDLSFDPMHVNLTATATDGQLARYLSVCPPNSDGTDGPCTQDAEELANVAVPRDRFGLSVFPAPSTLGRVFVAPTTGFVTAAPLPPVFGPYLYAIRSAQHGLIAVSDCRTSACTEVGHVFFVTGGDSITFELVTDSGLGPDDLTVTEQNGTAHIAPISRRRLDARNEASFPFAGGYRSLSATMWNENVAFDPDTVIADFENVALLTEERQNELVQTAFPPLAVPDSVFAGEPAWAGPMSAAFVSAGELHAARVGMVVGAPSDADRGGLFAGKYARQSITRSGYVGASLGLQPVPIAQLSLSLQATFSETSTTADMVDLDGDGVVDQIGGASTGLGILGTIAQAPFVFERGLRYRTGHEYSFNFGANPATRRTSPGGHSREVAVDGKAGGLLGGVGYAISRVQTKEDPLDLNGDGLLDRVRRDDSNIYVRYSLGRSFAENEEVYDTIDSAILGPIDGFESTIESTLSILGSTSDALQHDTSVSTTGSVGFGLDVPLVGGFSASRSDATTSTRTTRQLADLNGDGLPDLLFKRSDEGDAVGGVIHVQFSTGSGFGPPTQWVTPRWSANLLPTDDAVIGALGLTGGDVLGLSSAVSTTYSGSGSILGFGGSASRTRSTDRYEMGLIDMNGDGTPEHVLRTKRDRDDIIRIKNNRATGRANLLAAIHRPLGGRIELGYERTANSVDLPQSRQVLTSVTVDDGVNLGDAYASPNVVSTISYENGFHHRYEKEFFGFAKVTTRRADGVKRIDEYQNSPNLYALRGRLLRQTELDASDGLLAAKELTYEIRSVRDASSQPIAPSPSCTANLHPLLVDEPSACTPQHVLVVREQTTHAEGGTLAKTHTTRALEHDRFGNILESIDDGDAAINTDDLHARASYANDTSRWILGRVTSLVVRAGSSTGTVLRQRAGTYTARGQLASVSVATGSSAGTATSTLEYDAFGNLTRLTTPPNASNQSQIYEVEYDAATATYPVRTSDAFGLSSTASFDLRFGIATSETDTHGVTIARTLDAFGRLTSARGPYDTAAAPAITMQYFLGDASEPKARAVTVTRTSAPPGYSGSVAAPITAVTYVDGLARPIAMRKTAVVAGVLGMTTSGLLQRDGTGREILAYQPYHTPGAATDASLPLPATAPFATRTDYDAHDRPIAVTFPDGAVEGMAYAIEPAPIQGAPLLLVTKSIAANGNRRESYADQLGRVRAFVEHPTHPDTPQTPATAVSQYDYLATGELATIVDAESNKTTLTYDLRGLRTSFNNPDTGLIEDRFDAMGNRIALVEPNHRAAGAQVRFEFDRDRLVRIDYPSKPDVSMTYGATGAPSFGAGRLVRVDDESGSQAHSYGAQGEVVRTVRTVLPGEQGSQSLVFDTRFAVDSLGRQLSVRYPDGVTVTSRYDAAGMLSRIDGAGAGWSRVYASDLEYDVYGNRTRIRAGNGVVTTWEYEPQRVRLRKVDSTLASGRAIQALRYTFDPSNNPTKVENLLPALSGGSGLLPGDSSVDYRYDGVDRLVRATGRGQLSAQKTTTYDQKHGYSASHNLITKSRAHLISQPSLIPQAPGTTNFYSDYIYESGRPHLPSRIGDLLLTYDPSGNPVERRTPTTATVQTLVWDDDGRMVEFKGGGVNQRNTYDASGLRVRRKSTQSETVFASALFDVENGTQGVRHVFAGELRVASELGTFVSGENPTPPDKRATAYFFHGDRLGSTTVLTNDAGDVHQSLEYFPDGETWIDRGPQKPVNRYLFSGKPYDPDTGFFDFGQRFYEPRTGLWLGVDEALGGSPGLAVGAPVTLSASAFVGQNPLRNFDPDGRICIPCVVGLVFAGLVASEETEGEPRLSTAQIAARTAGGVVMASGPMVGAPIRHALRAKKVSAVTSVAAGTAASGTVANVGHVIAAGELPDAEQVATNFLLAGGFEVAGELLSATRAGRSPQSRPASQEPDMVYRAPRAEPTSATPHAAKTPGEHVFGTRKHLDGSPFESWTSERSIAEEFARARGTQVEALDLNTVPKSRIAADLRTPSGRAAAAAAESEVHLKNVLLKNSDFEVVLWREGCIPCQ